MKINSFNLEVVYDQVSFNYQYKKCTLHKNNHPEILPFKMLLTFSQQTKISSE